MKTNQAKLWSILSIIAPALCVISMLLLPFVSVDLYLTTETDSFCSLASSLTTESMITCMVPIILMAAATITALISRKKTAYIIEAVLAGLTMAGMIALMVSFNTFVSLAPVSTGDDIMDLFGSAANSINSMLMEPAWGIYVSIVLAVATLVFAVLAYQNADSAVPATGKVSTSQTTASAGKSSAQHHIVCIAGEFKNASFPLNPGESVVIGRDSAVSNIVIVAPKVSRKHCVIRFDASQNAYIVTDCSSNGTYGENGTRLMANKDNILPIGSEISLGSNDNRFRLE